MNLRKLHLICDRNAAWGMTSRFILHLAIYCPNFVDASGEIRTVSPDFCSLDDVSVHILVAWNVLYAVRPVGGLAWYTDACINAHALAFSILFYYSFICSHIYNGDDAIVISLAQSTSGASHIYHLSFYRISFSNKQYIREQYDSVTHFISFELNFSGIFIFSIFFSDEIWSKNSNCEQIKLLRFFLFFFMYSILYMFNWVYNFTEFAFRYVE